MQRRARSTSSVSTRAWRRSTSRRATCRFRRSRASSAPSPLRHRRRGERIARRPPAPVVRAARRSTRRGCRSCARCCATRLDPVAPQPAAASACSRPTSSRSPTSPFAFDTAPKTDFFADRDDRERPAETAPPRQRRRDRRRAAVHAAVTAVRRGRDAQSSGRSARTFVGLFAATGALAVVGTIWWALSRDSAPLSAATPPVITRQDRQPRRRQTPRRPQSPRRRRARWR